MKQVFSLTPWVIFLPGKIPDAHWRGVWVGFQGGMAVVDKTKIYFICQVPKHNVSGLQSLAQSTQWLHLMEDITMC